MLDSRLSDLGPSPDQGGEGGEGRGVGEGHCIRFLAKILFSHTTCVKMGTTKLMSGLISSTIQRGVEIFLVMSFCRRQALALLVLTQKKSADRRLHGHT